ncbi:peptidase M50 [Thermotomaculum hydrothermale]|uniref:Peptidase M50 n=1 Tax=Thermotomaculum hydrothermale TaxID=981385 RepID=A0A7R6PML0_9BACT|nr:site-2 protease family protein [Thermotomaculum hydrothermale]BBB32872.1 peptidase M50 [Thermotomaculum hydrothermale]
MDYKPYRIIEIYPEFEIEEPEKNLKYLLKKANERLTKKQKFLSIILFFITFFITTFIGGLDYISFYKLNYPFFSIKFWLGGLWYSLPLMLILASHEMGHFLTATYYGIDCTPPYFIPAPTFIGTFGAFIKIKSPFLSKRELFDVGIAGPLAGFIVAVPVLTLGIILSKPAGHIVNSKDVITFGEPLLYKIIVLIKYGTTKVDLILHPTGFAGWIGLLVSALNLLPVSQLDGGHISYAVFGKKSFLIAYGLAFVLFISSFFYSGWIIWLVLLIILGIKHPRFFFENEPLDKKRKILALIALLIFYPLICANTC